MRILIIHEEPIVVAGLLAVLNSEEDVTATAVPPLSQPLGITGLGLEPVDVVIGDYHSSLQLLRDSKLAARDGKPDCPPILVLTDRDREWEVRFAINAGVYGYLLKGCTVNEIVTGVRLAAARRRYMCERVTERIAESLTRISLTGRETEVLELLQRGMCNKTIARDLGVAPGTIKAHVRGILEKLESSTRTEAVAVATRRGLISATGHHVPNPTFGRDTNLRVPAHTASASRTQHA